MYEDLMYYIWKYKHFNGELRTKDGCALEIIHPGERNPHSGPDFINARIRINQTDWAGNVEMHVRSSDWFRHGHQNDEAFDGIILHIVYEDDASVCRKNGEEIPQFTLKPFVSTAMLYRYQQFMRSRDSIACAGQLHLLDIVKEKLWFPALAAERLEQKKDVLQSLFERTAHSWEDMLYMALARNFGFKVNALPFEMLSRQIPLKQFFRMEHHAVEAVLFGMSGLLPEYPEDDYPKALAKEFNFQKKRLNLKAIEKHLWKRTRPSNFPEIRLAQFAALMGSYQGLFSKIIEAGNIAVVRKFLENDIDTYWDTHYRFDKVSAKKKKNMGDAAINLLIINTILPVLFFYGKRMHQEVYCEQALDLLSQIPPEKNSIIDSFATIGLRADNALESQALLQLKKQYCVPKKCLQCRIGHELLQ